MKRPKQHRIDTQVQKAFALLVPDEWVARPLSPDYGLDYEIEIFNGTESTGKTFYVQLKGTETNFSGVKSKLQLDKNHLEYFRSRPLPILLVLYSTTQNKFWGVWINNVLDRLQLDESQKSLTLTFDEDQVIGTDFFDELESQDLLVIHKKVSVECIGDSEVAKRFHAKLKDYVQFYYGDFLKFDDAHYPVRLTIRYKFENDTLSLTLQYGSVGPYVLDGVNLNSESLILHIPTVDYSQIPPELHEPLFLIATLLAKDRISASLKLYSELIGVYSGKYNNVESLFRVASLAGIEHKITELQELAILCIRKGDFNSFQVFNMTLLFSSAKSGDDKVIKLYRENLRQAIANVNDDKFKGMLCYNLANSFSKDKRLWALKYYNKARKLEPEYIDRPYWCREVGGLLFGIKKYVLAEKLVSVPFNCT